jgi:hypothetical protein
MKSLRAMQRFLCAIPRRILAPVRACPVSGGPRKETSALRRMHAPGWIVVDSGADLLGYRVASSTAILKTCQQNIATTRYRSFSYGCCFPPGMDGAVAGATAPASLAAPGAAARVVPAMTCEQAFDALHEEQWRELARWLGLDLAVLMRMECHETLTAVARKLDFMAAGRRILH